jgi:hypothetical protein
MDGRQRDRAARPEREPELNKKAAKDKVDGIAALIMSMSLALADQAGAGGNYYENNPGLIVLDRTQDMGI